MSRFNPHFKNAPDVFAAADQFKQRCLLDHQSLFLAKELIWTPPHFAALVKNFVEQPDAGDRSFWVKLEDQMATCQPLEVALMAEIFWIVQLPVTNLRADTKLKDVRRIWEMKPGAPTPFPTQSPYLTQPVLSGLGSAGPGYNNYLPNELMFAVEAFAEFCGKPRVEREALLADGFKFAEWLNQIPSGRGRQLYHTLCHVLFPDTFERIFSRGNKNQVARAHGIWKPEYKESRTGLDHALLNLRATLEAAHPGEVDYYSKPVGTLLKQQGKHPGNTSGVAATALGQPAPDQQSVEEPGADYADEPAPALRHADNLIFYGPPGTGKTFEMQRRMKEAYDNGEEFEFVAFHPSYSYEDFVGGLRPFVSETSGGLAVRYEKGPFLRICEKAHAAPTEQFTLFIDEINRANVAKVFGELVTLIEPSKRVIAGSKPNDNGAWVRLPGTNELFGVPDNLNVVATMNTADRSIAVMDIALRRRFRFQECAPEPSQIKPQMVGTIDLAELLAKLNDRLEYLLDRDHAIGHAFFMDIDSLEDLRSVLAQRVIPLLQEFFFEDLDKVRLALTGSTRGSAFFTARSLKPGELFPNARGIVGGESRMSFEVTPTSNWSEEAIRGLYAVQAELAPAAESVPQSPQLPEV